MVSKKSFNVRGGFASPPIFGNKGCISSERVSGAGGLKD